MTGLLIKNQKYKPFFVSVKNKQPFSDNCGKFGLIFVTLLLLHSEMNCLRSANELQTKHTCFESCTGMPQVNQCINNVLFIAVPNILQALTQKLR